MKKINLYFQHGWGFDGGCWKAIMADIPEDYNRFCADRGYFGVESTGGDRPLSESTVTICHSLGLHLIDLEQLQKTDLLVVMAGFEFFHGPEESDGRFSRRHVKRMLIDLQKEPVSVLKKFYLDCSFSDSRSNLSRINIDKLADDLLLLDRHILDVTILDSIAQILILHGNKDRIVPIPHGIHLSSSLNNTSFVEIDGAGHGLIFTHHEMCWQIVAAAIKEM